MATTKIMQRLVALAAEPTIATIRFERWLYIATRVFTIIF